MMRLGYHVCEGPEQVNAERTATLTPIRWHETYKGMDHFPRFRVVEYPDARVVAFARDVCTIRDGDLVVLPKIEPVVAPPVLDDVPCSQPVDRPIALIVVKYAIVEVPAKEDRTKVVRKSYFLIVGQCIPLTSY